MTLDQIIVVIGGIVTIAAIYWFFFMKKTTAVQVAESIDIKVNGGYTPETLMLKKGTPTTLNFLRTDSNSCLEEITIPDFNIKKYLPMNERVSITITPQKSGEFGFACGMNMFRGTIIVH